MTTDFDAVRDALGDLLAHTLAERLGGAPVYVPACPSRNSPLVLALGHAAAARLCDAFAGQYLSLPSRHALAAKQRYEAIAYDLRRGLSVSDVARRHGVTARHIRNIKRARGAA